jgi:RNA polymerase sigma-70 factor (ECF subfamily)
MKRHPERVLDELLVLRSQAGDAGALEDLAERWNPRLLRHAYRLVGNADGARDVSQNAWIGIIRGLRRLSDPGKFPAWAFRIVEHKSRDWIRKESRRRRLDGKAMTLHLVDREQGPPVSKPDAVPIAAERVTRALRGLPESKKALLALYYVDGLSVGEIASILEVPAGTVKSRLFHARRLFREALEEGSDEGVRTGT